MPVKYVLRLYVTGVTPRNQAAIENLTKILNEDYKGVYSLKVIDVVKQPKLAEDDNILVTPTLIKIAPPPVARIIGDLSDREKVLLGLNLLAVRKAPGTSTALSANGERPSTKLRTALSERSKSNGRNRTIGKNK